MLGFSQTSNTAKKTNSYLLLSNTTAIIVHVVRKDKKKIM